MFALINDQRLQMNLPPLGFLSPALYELSVDNPSAFLDIRVGNNGVQPCCDGFFAEEGFDPLSGLGSPNFELLVELFTTVYV